MASEFIRRFIPEDIEDLNKKLKRSIDMLLILYSFLGYPLPAKPKPKPTPRYIDIESSIAISPLVVAREGIATESGLDMLELGCIVNPVINVESILDIPELSCKMPPVISEESSLDSPSASILLNPVINQESGLDSPSVETILT